MTNKEENKTNVRLVSLSNYERPTVIETVEKDYVLYGEDNAYYDTIIQRYLGSPTNARCINGISDMIYGRGLEATDRNINRDAYIEMKKLVDEGELRKVVGDRKLLGSAAIKVIYNKNKSKVIAIKHHPMETLRAEKTNKGVIAAYYYHPDWKNLKTGDKPKRIPTFGNGNPKQTTEVLIVRPYVSGFYYYSPCDYQSSLQYSQLEEEVSNYHLSNIENGLQPSLLINFNNGVPSEETQSLLESKISDKFSGSSNAGRFILSFNEDKDTAADVEAIHLPDAHAQYQFLADESREKIMLGHGIVSPILLGIKDNTGFGNNAEELRTASILMDNIVIAPFQHNIINAIDKILAYNKIFLSLYFVTLQPIEFVELDNISTSVVKEQETGEKLSSDTKLTSGEEDALIDALNESGEVIDDSWELIYTCDAETGVKLADANPNKASIEDKGIYKVRYQYAPVRNSSESRGFCKRIESLSANDIVFRKEDINNMSFRGVNKELGHNKQNYSLLKYKGGVNCHHFWNMLVFKKKGTGSVDIEEAVKEGLIIPNNPDEMTVRPVDMPNNGRFLSKLKQLINSVI
tara:strand:- start:2776 stop:4503 length:1728 start_codon:yes stop_codon:yes gene_type:complete